jgi:similar to stage IV sporulation protein
MNRVSCQLFGTVVLEITGAWPEQCLSRMAAARIPMDQIEKKDEMTCSVRIFRKDQARVEQIAARYGCTCCVLQRSGLKQKYGGIGKRVALLAGLAAALTVALLLPQFVWTVEVQGNVKVPTEKILRELEELGVHFGAYGPAIDSETIKNQLLVEIPELSWLAVNRSGGRAVVEVRERISTPEITDTKAITNVVAARTGLITNMEVYSGKAMVEEGQTVLQGELLVSGVAEWTNRTQYSHAMAVIYARTWHRLVSVVPQECVRLIPTGEEERVRTLIVGKKRIKLSGNSSISREDCGKIMEESTLTLPGGIELPIRLETVTYTICEPAEETMPAADAYAMMSETALERIKDSLLAGEILKTSGTEDAADGLYYYTTVAECSEQIAREVPVEPYEGES